MVDGAGPDKLVTSPNLPGTGAFEKGAAIDPDEAAREAAKARQVVKRYRVLEKHIVSDNGSRVALTPGKVIDSLNYNIERLQKQGVKLEEVTS